MPRALRRLRWRETVNCYKYISAVFLLVATLAAGFSVEAQDAPDHAVPAEKREAFLERRMSGDTVGRFGSFGSLLYALHDIVIHSDDKAINDTRLASPFPDSYRPTRRELFDAIARLTDSTWRYDTETHYWVFARPAAPPAYQIGLAAGWKQHETVNGNTTYQAPPNKPFGMNIIHMGSYSDPAGADRDPAESARFWNELRRAVALQCAQRINKKTSADDFVATRANGREALYVVCTPEGQNKINCHLWTLVVNGHGYLITCGTATDYGPEVPPEVIEMLETFEPAEAGILTQAPPPDARR